MPLHPDLEAFLELANANREEGGRPMSHMSVQEARAAYDASTSALDSPGAEVSTKNLTLPSRDGGLLKARLYLGPNAASPLPTLLFFHGGGYVLGGLDSHASLCRDLALRTPCAVLAIDYRLAPEHKFPTAFLDAEDASLWLLQHGGAHGLDTTRVVFGGDSVGGTLATALAIAARDAGRAQPALQLLLYPCTSARQDSASHQSFASGYLLERDTLQWMFRHYVRSEDDRLDFRFAPLQASNLAGLADAHIVLAEYDPLIDEGLAYASRLQAAGVAAQTQVYAGMVHDFVRLANLLSESDQVRGDIASVLAAAFARGATCALQAHPEPPNGTVPVQL
jgi:acetyl esterase/lipase